MFAYFSSLREAASSAAAPASGAARVTYYYYYYDRCSLWKNYRTSRRPSRLRLHQQHASNPAHHHVSTLSDHNHRPLYLYCWHTLSLALPGHRHTDNLQNLENDYKPNLQPESSKPNHLHTMMHFPAVNK